MYASGAYICAYAIERRISTRIGVPHLREGVIEMVEAWGRGMPLILKYESCQGTKAAKGQASDHEAKD